MGLRDRFYTQFVYNMSDSRKGITASPRLTLGVLRSMRNPLYNSQELMNQIRGIRAAIQALQDKEDWYLLCYKSVEGTDNTIEVIKGKVQKIAKVSEFDIISECKLQNEEVLREIAPLMNVSSPLGRKD